QLCRVARSRRTTPRFFRVRCFSPCCWRGVGAGAGAHGKLAAPEGIRGGGGRGCQGRVGSTSSQTSPARLFPAGPRGGRVEAVLVGVQLVEYTACHVADARVGETPSVPGAGHPGPLFGVIQRGDEQQLNGRARPFTSGKFRVSNQVKAWSRCSAV